MLFTASEIALCNLALRTTPEKAQDGRYLQRELSIDDFEDGVSINKKLKSTIKEDHFTDGEFELSTTEKALLLRILERPWSLDDAETLLSLKSKLL